LDKHFLTPLFSPDSIVVFAGKVDDPGSQTAQAQALHRALLAQSFSGTLTFLDVHTSGTLADLADTHADLAVIAVPAQEVAAALEIAGRIKCRAALVISSGTRLRHSPAAWRMAPASAVYCARVWSRVTLLKSS
jgi:acetyltransferase